MSFAGKVWRLLVGIKDALVLIFMLLFFLALFAVLSARPSPGTVHDGALLIDLNGSVVEEKSVADPFEILASGTVPTGEYAVRDIVRAIDAAAADERINSIALDMTSFLGGGQVHMQAIADALDRFRRTDKKVLTFALAYGDDALLLAAHSDEVWVDPMGGAVVQGPGGEHLYYSGLLERFGVNAHVYRAGTYKSAVEPYMLSGMSEPARENATALYAALFEEWQANVKKGRPDAQIEKVATDPVGWIEESKGNLANASLAAGLVDKIGDRAAFGARVAEIAGSDSWDSAPGAFAHTDLKTWLAANRAPRNGKAIAVVTIAGDIVDGDAGPGTAGSDRIAGLLDDALDRDIAGLVVRVDSPGGEVTGAEEIRRAIMRYKDRGIPIAVSMANYAASGGYWVATPADAIFAEPETVTGSIGVFSVVPSFEGTLSKYGVTSDGVRTTPLSGQPDIFGGFTPETDTLLQALNTDIYRQFLTLVAASRGKTTEQIDEIAQGRVWDGGSARQLGLVDRFGGLDNALAWVAKKAGLEDGKWHAEFLESPPDEFSQIVLGLLGEEEQAPAPNDAVALISARQDDLLGRVMSDLDRLLGTRGAQAYCLECAAPPTQAPRRNANAGWLATLASLAH